MQEYGEPDAYGHRKKMSVAEDLSAELKLRTGEETVVSDLTYDLRSGDPDFTDKLIASTFGTIALERSSRKKSGLMTAIQNGCYALAPIPDPKLGPPKVDSPTMYNTERYRPITPTNSAFPVFLIRGLKPCVGYRLVSPEPEKVSKLEEIRRSFNEAAADEEHFPSTIDPRIYHVQLILENFGDLTGKRVLDVGCGKGRFARILRSVISGGHGRP